uniref:cAMP responsive element binding protein 3 like 1 n=1 Tax=Equus asinus asinus TaxID=83772 RepID=A0A8C4M660_EQUAS
MDAVLEPFPADRLFPGSSFLDLGDLNESDFLNNAHFPEHLDHFTENMEDFSNDLFSSFFDDPVLDEKGPLLDMELDSPTPGIQAEHSYSLSGDSAPQSPLVPIKMEDTTQDVEHGAWVLGHKLCSVMVKQEQSPELPVDPLAASSAMAAAAAMATTPLLGLSPLSRLPVAPHQAPGEMTQLPVIKAEPQEVNQFLKVTPGTCVQRGTLPIQSWATTSRLPWSSPCISLRTPSSPQNILSSLPTLHPFRFFPSLRLSSLISIRRKKKEYVECLEKKVETFTSENNELWKKVETLENANRTLLQQLQKLQTLVTNKISRPYKMAATQTGTCLMVGAIPSPQGHGRTSLPQAEEGQMRKEAGLPWRRGSPQAPSPVPSRSLLFYDEGAGSWEDGRSALLPVEPPDGWEIKPGGPAEQRPQDHLQLDHLDSTHETSKYLSEAWPKDGSGNGTSPDFSHPKEWFHERWAGGLFPSWGPRLHLPSARPLVPMSATPSHPSCVQIQLADGCASLLDRVTPDFSSLSRDLGPNTTIKLS